MRAAQDLTGYDGLIKHWMENRLTLRYTGGLVRALSPSTRKASFPFRASIRRPRMQDPSSARCLVSC